MRVSASGGAASPVTVLDSSRGESAHLTPVFLSDGRHFFYLRASRTDPERTGVFIGSLDVPSGEQDGRRLVATTTSPIYVRPADGRPGRLLFLRDGNLMAQGFDEGRLDLSGAPVLVAERVHSYLDTATVSASDNDVLVYKSAGDDLQLRWVDRQGRSIGHVSEPGLYGGLSLSPDAARAVVARVDPQVTSNADLWLLDLARSTSTRLSSTGVADAAVWSPDGSRIAFAANRFGSQTDLVQKASSGIGQEELLLRSDGGAAPASWSRDGRFLLYVVLDPKTNSDVWVLPLAGASRPFPFLRSDAAESQPQFAPHPQGSPRWVAYTSNESGRDEVHLRAFPDGQNQLLVSTNGGHSPRWRGDGRELFYVAAGGAIMATEVSADNQLRVGAPTRLFQAPRGFAGRDSTGSRGAAPWDVASDGQRFLFAAPAEAAAAPQFTVVLNWQTELAK